MSEARNSVEGMAMEWNARARNEMEWNEVEWNGRNGVEWNEMEWNGVYGMERNQLLKIDARSSQIRAPGLPKSVPEVPGGTQIPCWEHF